MAYQYKGVICAGTFDRLHAGHKAFLRFAFSLAEKVYVTITSDTYTAAHKPFVAPYQERAQTVRNFLSQEGLLGRAELVSINDVYGISLDITLPFEALVVTEETIKGALAVNAKRQAYGLPPLAIELAPLTPGETGLRLSSSHVRTGWVDTSGAITAKNDFMTATLHLPDKLRERLQKPFGKLVDPAELVSVDHKKIIAVGDITTQRLHEAGIRQPLSLIDHVVERQKQETTLASLGFTDAEIILHASNPPGTLTPRLWQCISEALQLWEESTVVIVVDGEEDLAVLPLLLLVPVGFVICYGQPHEGMVMVPVTEETKEEALVLLSAFDRDTTRGH